MTQKTSELTTMNGIPTLTAYKLIDELRITQSDLLDHLDEIAYKRGALVIEGDLKGSEARLNMLGKPAIITLSRTVSNAGRKRFSVAHEIGHLELHRRRFTLCTNTDMMEWSVSANSETTELEANEFAAAFLMPENFFRPLCDAPPTLDYFSEIADRFRVSLTATAVRYCEFTPEPVAVAFSQGGYVKWFRGSQEFGELELFVNVRGRVYSGSRAALFFAGKPIPKSPHRIAANAWLREGNFHSDYSLIEQSWAMDSANGVLTLLWADEGPDDSDGY